jgi:hypothetical protein
MNTYIEGENQNLFEPNLGGKIKTLMMLGKKTKSQRTPCLVDHIEIQR